MFAQVGPFSCIENRIGFNFGNNKMDVIKMRNLFKKADRRLEVVFVDVTT